MHSGVVNVKIAAAWCKKHNLEMPQFAELIQDKLKEEKQAMEVEQQILDTQVATSVLNHA